MKSLYQDLIYAGIECSSWQSDLYFPINDVTREIAKNHPEIKFSSFRSNVDGRLMYEAPFQYEPWWTARGM